jgi:hypothetical protein
MSGHVGDSFAKQYGLWHDERAQRIACFSRVADSCSRPPEMSADDLLQVNVAW